MLRKTALLVATPLLLPVLAACGSDGEDARSTVPAGVEEQYSVLADEIAEKGRTVRSGEWTVNLITEDAEPWYVGEHAAHGTSVFREPAAGETNHVEIIPVESATGRIVPDVPITVAVVDEAGKVVQERDLSFYYSTFFHYADNFSIPRQGDYTLRVTIGAPAFNRHGEPGTTAPLSKGATVEFDDVALGAA
jgi:hypothetical protein